MIHLLVFPHFFQPNSRINLKTKNTRKLSRFMTFTGNLNMAAGFPQRSEGWMPRSWWWTSDAVWRGSVSRRFFLRSFFRCSNDPTFIPRMTSKDQKVPPPLAICYTSQPNSRPYEGMINYHDPLGRPFCLISIEWRHGKGGHLEIHMNSDPANGDIQVSYPLDYPN